MQHKSTICMHIFKLSQAVEMTEMEESEGLLAEEDRGSGTDKSKLVSLSSSSSSSSSGRSHE